MNEETTLWHERRIWRVDGRLSKKQARRILDRGAPDLGHDIVEGQPCQWVKGEVVRFSPELEVEILKVSKRDGRWSINYLVRDLRPKLLGRQVGYTDDPSRATKVSEHSEDGWFPELEAVDAPEKTPEQEQSEFEIRKARTRRPGKRERKAA